MSLDHDALNRIDAALNLDEDTRAARNRMLSTVLGVKTAEELWETYRSVAMPPNAPAVQINETRRAIYWAATAMAQLMTAHPERVPMILQGIQEHGMAELRGVLR